MYRLIIFVFFTISLACSSKGNKQKVSSGNKTTESEIKADAFDINYVGKTDVTLSDVLVCKYSSADGQKVDSVLYSVGSFKGVSSDISDSTFSMDISRFPVGIQSVAYTIFYNESLTQTGSINVKILPDTEPERYTYRVKKSFPHNTSSYTQGLEFDGDILYEGTGMPGESTLSKILLDKNETVHTISIPSDKFGEGVTILNNKVYQLTWHGMVGYVYNKETLQKIDEFSYSTEGWGICNDGSQLIMTDGSEKVYFLDTVYMQETRRIQVYDKDGPVDSLNELEYIDGLVYANIYTTDNIVAFDPATGKVVKHINLKGILNPKDINGRIDVLNGIAYDHSNKRMIVTGKWWPKLYEIELVKL